MTGDQKRRMLAGELYRPDDPQLTADRDRCRRLVERLNASNTDDADRRGALLGELLGGIGAGSMVMPPVQLDYGFNTTIGARSFVNYGAVILDAAPVWIGDDVQIGPNVQLLTSTHPLEAKVRRSGVEAALPISIGDGTWLGGGVIVLPGVSIGPDAVVGAGSVVTVAPCSERMRASIR